MRYRSEGSLTDQGEDLWQPKPLQAGRRFNAPTALFKKLDHSIVEAERQRLGQPEA